MKQTFFQQLSEFDELLPFSFAGVGVSYEQETVKRPSEYKYLQWMFSEYQWIQTCKGTGELLLNGNKYTIKEGQGMLLCPNEPHEYYSSDGVWETDWIIFKGTETDNFVRNVLKINTSGVYYISEPEAIANKIKKIYNLSISHEPTKNLSQSVIVYQILMDIFKLTSQKQNSAIANATKKIEPVLIYIHANFNKQISLTELAEMLNITPQHLCRIFKKITSYTVAEYINKVRIQKSKDMLMSDKQRQIKEIAFNVGFNSVSYFCSIFKKSEQISPEEFRRFYGLY